MVFSVTEILIHFIFVKLSVELSTTKLTIILLFSRIVYSRSIKVALVLSDKRKGN